MGNESTIIEHYNVVRDVAGELETKDFHFILTEFLLEEPMM